MAITLPQIFLLFLTWSHLEAMTLGTNFWNIGWGIKDDMFAANAVFAEGQNPWNRTMLVEVGIHKVIRTMDWTPTNNVDLASWATREPLTGTQASRVAWEWQADLANRMGADLWITVPTMADDAYLTELAKLMKSRLDPGRKLYIEWSNETWNWGFLQAAYCATAGEALGLPGDKYQKGFGYQSIGALKVWKAFLAVYGSESNRLIKVLAGQSGNDWLAGVHLDMLDDLKYNPTGIMPDVYATAPYIGHENDGLDPNLWNSLRSKLPKLTADNRKIRDRMQARKIGFVAYEGGQHIANYSTEAGAHSNVANRDPRMYGFYKEYLDSMATIYTVFVHYLHSGEAGPKGSWGSLEHTGQPIADAPKYRALKDWTVAHPDGRGNAGRFFYGSTVSVPREERDFVDILGRTRTLGYFPIQIQKLFPRL
ncbi:MAG: hypothetical protein M3Y08_05700 [Fibrobacterota bacterium]|nr:hypothetical protein [Fibrobacterota bacterium]